jgi:hypothetical protein
VGDISGLADRPENRAKSVVFKDMSLSPRGFIRSGCVARISAIFRKQYIEYGRVILESGIR